MNESNPRLRGSRAIGKALQVHARTVQRWGQKGIIPAYKDADRTSPWSIDRADLDRLRGPLLHRDTE